MPNLHGLTNSMPLFAITVCILSLGCFAIACGRCAYADDHQTLPKELSSIVQSQAEDWNRGDIDAFMKAYWKSEELTFSSGGTTERGWEATRKRYHARYPDRATMGKLKFSDLEVQALSNDAALMLGRWHLERENPAGGNFSLVWKKIDGKWLIIHDHSSSASEK
jgi:ketosteroid isomerase-like protein